MNNTVRLFPDPVMFCEICGGAMFEAPKGSQTLACIKCGVVKYE
tara:strand:+ start:520 stop:651 length:132 start_codon:yes stop_codon:yes gene_type:complete